MQTWRHSDYTATLEASRARFQTVFFLLVFYGLILNVINHVSLYQIGSNPLLYPDLDPLYWLFMMAKVPDWLRGPAALFLDIFLILSCCLSIFDQRKKTWPIVFLVLYYMYFVIYNMRTGHHYTNPAILIMGMAFVVNKPVRFAALLTLSRFIFCFMMFSAAIWKIIRGNLFDAGHARNVLINQHLETLTTGQESWRDLIIRQVLATHWLPQLFWVLLILVELLFVLGFFTLRYDKHLLIAYILFFIGGWLLFDVYIYENLLFLLTLSPLVKLMNKTTFAR